jgi:hypothetical protein
MSIKKTVKGYFTQLDGEQFYKIENYDCMEDFFMTITSSSDIWNFCWSQGGITAGRKDCDHALFPYYTADKVSDAKSYTGSYTAVAVKKDGALHIWEPFAPLAGSEAEQTLPDNKIVRSIYKNAEGTSVWFEEINSGLSLAFRYGWTSSAKFGLVRRVHVENLAPAVVTFSILDGCRNILPACCTADFQNNNSVLLDAYKKTDLDREANIAFFAVSSIVTDKAEPSEGLYANTCWFTTENTLLISPDTPKQFIQAAVRVNTAGKNIRVSRSLAAADVIKGRRPACYICRDIELGATGSSTSSDNWSQILDTALDACRIALLKEQLKDRAEAGRLLQDDITSGIKLMEQYTADADGIQHTADTMTCDHHSANVMFNIMRGGIFADNGKVNAEDFIAFVRQRNKASVPAAESAAAAGDIRKAVESSGNPQLMRLFLEYMPLTFSRRHGDPSRPWNRFNIKLRDETGSPILNYEGNWRDIFQNWEALAWSYPWYTENMYAKFLNAMTADGFNPYRISREGIDWEIPDPDNPWAQIGYWGDHQIIYLQKLLEFQNRTNRSRLLGSLNSMLYSTANVPYRIKPYADILKNPRDTIVFDHKLNDALQKTAAADGSDAKLIIGKDGQPALVSLTAKLLQIVITKAANFIPGGGIWLNTQRPEWNDANNALAGYGLSLVTLCYLRRYTAFLIDIYTHTDGTSFTVPGEVADCFTALGRHYAENCPEATAADSGKRRVFADKAEILFETERKALYAAGYSQKEQELGKDDILTALKAILAHVEQTIRMNERPDGLYHAYNTMEITGSGMKISYLLEMLEGQVAVLSSGILSPDEVLALFRSLKTSALFEKRQYSYMLYPDKELPLFYVKNCVPPDAVKGLLPLLAKTGTKILARDCTGIYHFSPEFRNVRIMKAYIENLPVQDAPSPQENQALCALYEKTFKHQSFTGRSGTFYAYEGLGSIYWHMVSKLLLAVQENVFISLEKVYAGTCSIHTAKELAAAYYDVRKGIGFNKEPEVYGAFPFDPYSHTPSGQGAKQPGMTGQVKEEIITRWGELGITVKNGTASFNPVLLRRSEFFDNGTLNFTWCGVPVTYHLAEKDSISVAGTIQAARSGTSLTKEETAELFSRNRTIKSIDVWSSMTEMITGK